ncbi:BTB/POZ domain-containing protein KCTD14 isoform X1 [Brachyistius frenatus]|uniref:BTB/POZ domain-containing protein KCTD14 isoform X1 n=1 Tax=Brachyistius frenatus TaxID=100188 RepID=UPI0037E7AB20
MLNMSLADHKPSEEQPSSAVPQSSVVHLNVGGHLFSTCLSTLRKHNSKLAALFDGPTELIGSDAHGRRFIDRDGSHFGAVLEFLRSDRLPVENLHEVHREALHYDIQPLFKRLEETPQMFGELVGRQQFLSRVPRYQENIEVLIRIARAEAVAARRSTIMICVLQTEEDLGFLDDAVNSLEADKESAVTFGPWKAAPSVEDLLDCVKTDVERRGYRVSVLPHVTGRSFLSRSYGFFYDLTFTWW